MRENYLKSILGALLMLIVSVQASAQTAYVMTSSVSSKKAAYIYSFDVNNPGGEKNTIWTDTTFNVGGFMGALAENTYYVFTKEVDEDTDNITYAFCTINMTTGNKVVLNPSVKPGTDVIWMGDICYDATTKKLYGLRQVVLYTEDANGDISGEKVFQLCTIDMQTGEWTEFTDVSLGASADLGNVASDGNGGIYVMGVAKGKTFTDAYINVYRIDLGTKEQTTLVESSDNAMIKAIHSYLGSTSPKSMELYNNVLYIIGTNRLVTFDLATKTATLHVVNNSAVTLVDSPVGLCFAKSTADGVSGDIEEPVTPDNDEKVTLVKAVETWGDIMGASSYDTCSTRKMTFYDAENRPVRMVECGKYVNNDVYEVTSYTKYDYNEAGQLELMYSFQRGIYDGEDFAFKALVDTIRYVYNDAGQLIKESTVQQGIDRRHILYEYDESGNVIKEEQWASDPTHYYSPDDYFLNYSKTYSDFIAPNKPQTIVGDGYFEKYKFITKITYNEAGQPLVSKNYKPDGVTPKNFSEYWTYDETGMQVQYEQKKVSSQGVETDYIRIVDTLLTDNRVKRQSYSYDNIIKKWAKNSTYTITETAEYSRSYAPALAVEEYSAEISEPNHNTVRLTITPPSELPVTNHLGFDIYRHGMLIEHLTFSKGDNYDKEKNVFYYVDRDVPNGEYDYYVQTVILDELHESKAMTANVSNIVTYKHYVELPAASNIQYVSNRKEDGVNFVTVKWDAPVYDETLKFLRYNVFFDGVWMAENSPTWGSERPNGDYAGQNTSFELVYGSATKENIYVQTVYHYGKVNSEVVTIDISELLDVNALEGETCAKWDSGVLTVSQVADIAVYTTAGTCVKNLKSVTSVDLNGSPKGLYIIMVNQGNQMTLFKVNL